MPKMSNRTLQTLLLLAFFSTILHGQNSLNEIEKIISKNNFKVGLVLSGGGAKGMAHVGVIKMLEKAGVQIDHIAGTSMGAVIGGLYAAGYNAKQLDSIVKATDFDNLLQDDLPRSAKTFYERDDAERYALTLPFDQFKIDVPQGYSKGQNYYNLLSKLLVHVSDIKNFNALPIPFACVATNIETGDPVTLDKGYLPQAIGASAALPSVFNPVTINDTILVDGGVSNNYPVEILREKGIDLVIGVDVQDNLRERKDLASFSNIMIQINNFKTIEAMVSKKKLTDIYLKPNIQEYGIVAFDEINEIIVKGEQAAVQNMALFSAIAKKQKTKKTLHKSHIKPVDSIKINAVSFLGNKKYTSAYIKGKLKLRPPEKLSFTQLKQRLNNLSATGNFERITYKIQPWQDGNLLQLNIEESKSTQSLRLAAHYDNLFQSGVLINLTKKSLLFGNDILSLDFILGDNIRYNLDYYIDKGYYWSFGVRSKLNRFNTSINSQIASDLSGVNLDNLNTININYTDLTNQVYLRTVWLKKFLLELGGEHKFLNIRSTNITDDDVDFEGFTFENSDILSLFGVLKYDSLDHKYFPQNGLLFNANFNWYLSSSNFTNSFQKVGVAKAHFKWAKNLTKHLTLITEIAGGAHIGETQNTSFNFLLGGYGAINVNNITSFLGYDFIGFGAQDFAKLGVAFDYQFLKKHHINIAANYANAENDMYMSGSWISPPEYTGYGLGYGFDTFLGPLELKYTYSPEIRTSNWMFSLGFWF